MSKGERWAIAANIVNDPIYRVGAKVVILYTPGNQESAKVKGISKGGRVVRKWIQTVRLTHFRPTMILDTAGIVDHWSSKELAVEVIASRFPTIEATQ